MIELKNDWVGVTQQSLTYSCGNQKLPPKGPSQSHLVLLIADILLVNLFPSCIMQCTYKQRSRFKTLQDMHIRTV